MLQFLSQSPRAALSLLHLLPRPICRQADNSSFGRCLPSVIRRIFTSEEKMVIALVARYHRKKAPEQSHRKFVSLSAEWQQFIRVAAAVLRISDGMDRSHQSSVEDVIVSVTDGAAFFVMTGNANLAVDIWGADRKKSFFEEVFRLQATFTAGGKKQ